MREFVAAASHTCHRTLRRSAAFTLIEMMVAVTLLGLLIATVGPTMRRSSVSTKGGAVALAAALAEARQQAISQQVPVALIIPSGNGSQGQANSYYLAAGEQPRVTQVKNLGDEQPDLRLMVGVWPLDTGKLRDASATTTITPPPEATWENDFDLNLWGLPEAKDYAFVFTPRGKLVTNDLPHFDGAFHIAVSHGGRTSPSSAPGSGVMTTPPILHSLTQLGSPYTVSITPAGAVSVTPGLLAASGVEIKEQAAVTVPPDPPPLSPPPSSAPIVTSVTLRPDPAKLSPPSGVDMLLAPGRHMTMTVRATSPEKAQLFCQWKATDGGLSSPKEVRATYLPQTQEWESVWQWRFPVDADPGDRVTLEGVIKDSFGNEAAVGLGAEAAPFVVQAGDPSTKVVFNSLRVGVSDNLFQVYADGTGLTSLSGGRGEATNPNLSPDGQRVACHSGRDGNQEIYIMNADGSGQTRLTNHAATDQYAVWSPRGTQIAFCSTRWTGGWNIGVMNADGTGARKVSTHSSWQSGPSIPVWSPDGSRIAFTSQFPSGQLDIFVVRADGSGQIRLTNNTTYDGDVHWSADGTKIGFLAQRAGEWEICVKNADGTGPETLLTNNAPGADDTPVWSPDGTRIAFVSRQTGDAEVFLMNPDGTGQTNLTNRSGDDTSPAWSGNGRYIAYMGTGTGNWELFVMNADGTNPVNVTNHPGSDWNFHIR